MGKGVREWVCRRCGAEYVASLPVTAVRCECSKRAGGREYWMTPKDGAR
jgi:hypothetical protein